MVCLGGLILKGCLFFQLVNKTKIGWKYRVPESILGPFNKWKGKVEFLRNVQIPRWTSCLGMEDSIAQLCIFCDASAIGYGIVAYIIRQLKGGGKIHLFLDVESPRCSVGNAAGPSLWAAAAWG